MNFIHYLKKLNFDLFENIEKDFFYNYIYDRFEKKNEAFLFADYHSKLIYSKNSNNLIALINLYFYIVENTHTFLAKKENQTGPDFFDYSFSTTHSRVASQRIFNTASLRHLCPKLEEPERTQLDSYNKFIEGLLEDKNILEIKQTELYTEMRGIESAILETKDKLEAELLLELKDYNVSKDYYEGADEKRYFIKDSLKKKLNAYYAGEPEINEELLAIFAFIQINRIGGRLFIWNNEELANELAKSEFDQYFLIKEKALKISKDIDRIDHRIKQSEESRGEEEEAYNAELGRYQQSINNIPIFKKLIIDFRYLCAKVDLSK